MKKMIPKLKDIFFNGNQEILEKSYTKYKV